MFVCTECGQPGASYCPIVSENGPAEAGYIHPVCHARKSITDGVTEYTNLRRASVHGGRSDRVGAPNLQRGTVRSVRVSLGKPGKPVQSALRRL